MFSGAKCGANFSLKAYCNLVKKVEVVILLPRNQNNKVSFILYTKEYNMPFKKGISGNPVDRPKGSLSTTTKNIREHISQAIDGNKIM